jgi:hypothetical protein
MTDDPADALRELAEDIEQDALEFNPRTPHEQGIAEGLGRAVGRAKHRAAQKENE